MRRTFVTLVIALCASLAAVVLTVAEAAPTAAKARNEQSTAAAFSFDDVAALAQRLSQQPWQAPVDALPAELAALGYDTLRDIRFRPDRALWRAQGLPFEVQFFHLGGGLRQPVQVHEVVDGRATELHYSADDWNFGGNRFSQGPARWGALGHAGLRVHYSLNSPAYKDELAVFLGASYFRALGRDQQYGLSARGLALDTVGGAGPEEFPRFSAFWLERPAADASAVVVHALLESPRVTGAYRFTITPGDNTTVDVQARLFLRTSAQPALATVATFGIAPLTSMYLHGENQPSAADFRPEVHDSDGLLVAATGPGAATGAAPEWLWRPLARPGQPLASSFAVQRLQGFGLMQRERRFSAYEDTEARYDRRPSAWVEPLGDWGPGRVELLLLPTPDETEDNVVAYWVPASLPKPGQALEMAWRVHWQGDALQQPPAGWTVQSRRGRSWAEPLPGEIKFVVDFDGPALRALPADSSVDVVATVPSNARVLDSRAWRHPQGGWRMQLRVQRQDPEQPVELRAFLRQGSQTLTETWTALVPKE